MQTAAGTCVALSLVFRRGHRLAQSTPLQPPQSCQAQRRAPGVPDLHALPLPSSCKQAALAGAVLSRLTGRWRPHHSPDGLSARRKVKQQRQPTNAGSAGCSIAPASVALLSSCWLHRVQCDCAVPAADLHKQLWSRAGRCKHWSAYQHQQCSSSPVAGRAGPQSARPGCWGSCCPGELRLQRRPHLAALALGRPQDPEQRVIVSSCQPCVWLTHAASRLHLRRSLPVRAD